MDSHIGSLLEGLSWSWNVRRQMPDPPHVIIVKIRTKFFMFLNAAGEDSLFSSILKDAEFETLWLQTSIYGRSWGAGGWGICPLARMSGPHQRSRVGLTSLRIFLLWVSSLRMHPCHPPWGCFLWPCGGAGWQFGPTSFWCGLFPYLLRSYDLDGETFFGSITQFLWQQKQIEQQQ